MAVSTIANGSVLVYNDTIDKWVAGVGGGSGGTITAQLNTRPCHDENVDVVTCLHLCTDDTARCKPVDRSVTALH